nr:AHS alpha [Pseudechiniscus sp.]
MNTVFVALGLALVAATCVFALELPEVKDQPGTPIDPKQIKNATVTFYNNGTYIYTLEVPCEAYLGQRGGAAGRQQQQSGRQQQQQPPHGDDHEDENDDDDSDEPSQMTPQQRQQQRQRQQQQQQGQRSQQSRGGMSPHHEHLGPEELREAHKGTECECQCKNQQGEELDDVIRVSFGGASGKSHSSSSRRGGSRQDQQQRLQQRNQDRQRQRGSSGSGQQKPRVQKSGGEEEGPELVYPEQPRPGQKCIFFEEGEWENDDDGKCVASRLLLSASFLGV